MPANAQKSCADKNWDENDPARFWINSIGAILGNCANTLGKFSVIVKREGARSPSGIHGPIYDVANASFEISNYIRKIKRTTGNDTLSLSAPYASEKSSEIQLNTQFDLFDITYSSPQ